MTSNGWFSLSKKIKHPQAKREIGKCECVSIGGVTEASFRNKIFEILIEI